MVSTSLKDIPVQIYEEKSTSSLDRSGSKSKPNGGIEQDEFKKPSHTRNRYRKRHINNYRMVIQILISNFVRSDAESISTSTSQNSNKENLLESSPSPAESTVAGDEVTEVVLRRKTDSKVSNII